MVFDKIKEILVDQLTLPEDEITMDSTLESLGVDSLDLVDIVMAVEDEFNLEIPDDEMQNFSTIGDVVRYIEETI